MAGELLFRVLNRRALEDLTPHEHAGQESANSVFLDLGHWSLTAPTGRDYVVVDGPSFATEASWMYERHDALDAVAIANTETATLAVPRDVVLEWRRRLDELPADGEVGRTVPEVRDALMALMDLTLTDEWMTLTVQSLL
jgi:hypothetical protein